MFSAPSAREQELRHFQGTFDALRIDVADVALLYKARLHLASISPRRQGGFLWLLDATPVVNVYLFNGEDILRVRLRG